MFERSAFPAALDAWSRPLRDLRISVTDRCNFRCRYCMPREKFADVEFLARAELLSFEEIRRVAGCFVALGVEKLRITGGEPLLRRDLATLVGSLTELKVDLALTTNGALLAREVGALRRAGLGRLTVSLDALDEAAFQRICDAPGNTVRRVLDGIEAAEREGYQSVKINCVVRRGVNEDQVEPLARFFMGAGHVLRFIEYMDVGEENGWQPRDVTLGEEILERLSVLGTVQALPQTSASEVARRYLVADRLEIGLITSVSEPFCGACSRMRLSADGGLYTCLFSGQRHDLKSRLRRGDTDAELGAYLRSVWAERRDRYSEERAQIAAKAAEPGGVVRLPVLPRVAMSFIGG